VLDPIVVAAGIGILVSPLAARALSHGLERLPERRRRPTTWLLVAVVVVAATLGELWWEGPMQEGVFVFLLGLLPGMFAFLAFRTAWASALLSLVPLYFGIGALTLGRPLHRPEIALDRALSPQPAWMLVYGSLYVFVFLPLLVVRQASLFRRVLQAWVMVLSLAYVGFVAYPTVAPWPGQVLGGGFCAWWLRLQYSLDQPYNCFPSLHVAHSFVSALASYRVHEGVGRVALLWASLIGISTLYTKQHYAVDVIVGVLIAYLAYACFLRRHPRELVEAGDRDRAPRRALGVVGLFVLMVACFWGLYVTGVAP
jgi:membrane-associated phospholipid phosphatase